MDSDRGRVFVEAMDGGLIDVTEVTQSVGLGVPHAVPSGELERLITAIDQHYVVEDLGYAGDARVVNLRDKVSGEYIMTASLTQTP